MSFREATGSSAVRDATKIVIAFVWFSLTFSVRSEAQTNGVRLTFDNQFCNYNGGQCSNNATLCKMDGFGTHWYYQGAAKVSTQCQGAGAWPATFPKVSTVDGENFIQFRTAPDTDETGAWNRSEMAIGDDLADRTYHYVGFRWRLVTPPSGRAYLAQILYQNYSGPTAPVGGIMYMGLDDQGQHRWEFYHQATTELSPGVFSDPQHRHSCNLPFNLGEWVSVVFRVYMDPYSNDASIKCWVKDQLEETWRGTEEVTYPGRYGHLGTRFLSGWAGDPRKNFDMKLGIYTREVDESIRVDFDDVAVGNSYHAVVPW